MLKIAICDDNKVCLQELRAGLAVVFKNRQDEYKITGFTSGSQLLCGCGYLDTLTDTVKQLDNRISTGNEFADAIINEKMAVMAEKNIVFTEDISLPEKCRLEPVELCCILSNTLDNATQACEQIDGERWIKAEAFIRQSHLVIIIENSIEVPNKSKALPSYSHAERGIGLLNVRTVVEKYGGAMEVSRDKTFVFSAMLPMD